MYHPMQMHLHTCHQPGGSMEGHIYNAQKLGMQYIRFTDHDTRTGRKECPVTCFDFSKGELEYNDCKHGTVALDLFGDPDYRFENGALVLKDMKKEKRSGVYLRSSGKRHTSTLLADVKLTLGFDYELPEGARILLDVRLSQRPPEHKAAHFKYVLGGLSAACNPEVVEKMLEPSPDGVYILDLTADIESADSIGGLDNVFDTLLVTLEGGASISLNRFEISTKYGFNDVILRQRELADKIGEKYGVKPFVTTEISAAGQHKNVFDTKVPVINYEELGYRVSQDQAIEHVKRYGGIFGYNHPFENNEYKKGGFTEEDIPALVEKEAEYLIENKLFGATLMEVGFIDGRGLFGLKEYLELWDRLSLAGVFVTAYGDSDSHDNRKGWFDGNNFAAWIFAPNEEKFPIDEKHFVFSMKAGRVYTGDPVYLKGKIELNVDAVPMGGVVSVDKKHYCRVRRLYFRNAKALEGSVVRVIVDGECVYTDEVSADGNYELTYTFTPSNAISFVRVEAYNSDGRCILLTNPIYFVRTEKFDGEIPEERIYKFPTPEIPDEIFEFTGKRILHIGDTESWRYSFYRELISIVKPDVIIHTGDMADEVKVGRMPEVRDEYIEKIAEMAEILNNSGAEKIYIVPGNNDLPDEISRLVPTAQMMKNSWRIEVDGIEGRVGHQVTSINYDKQWAFYGHGYTGETWQYEQNREGGECRFNACNGAFIVSFKDNKYYKVDLPKY